MWVWRFAGCHRTVVGCVVFWGCNSFSVCFGVARLFFSTPSACFHAEAGAMCV